MGLSRRAAIVASGRIATTASILIVNALLARAWEPDTFGTFTAIWVLGNTLVPFFLLGLPGALLFTLPRRDPNQVGFLLWRTTAVLGLSALALCVILWLGAPLIGASIELTPAILRGFLLAFLPYVFCLVAGGHIEAALVATGRHVWQALIAWSGSAILIGSATAAYTLQLSVQQTFIALSVAGLIRLCLAYLVLASARLPHLGEADGFADFLRYAITIGVGEGVGSLSRSVDRLVVLLLLDPGRLGIYHLGAIEVPISLVLASLVTVMIPEVSRLMAAGEHQQVADLFRVAVVRLSWLILPLFFFLFVFAADVMDLYLPPQYAKSADVFRCFLLVLPLRCAIYNPILVGSGRANWAFFGALGDLLLNASVSVALVLWLRDSQPTWAILGPAVATVGATYLQVLALLLAIAHLLKRPLWRLVPWAHLLRVSAFALIAAMLAQWVAGAIYDTAGLHLVVGGIVMAIGVWGIPACLRVEDRRELSAILAALRRKQSSP